MGFRLKSNQFNFSLAKTSRRLQFPNRNAKTAKENVNQKQPMTENARQPQNNILPPKRGKRLEMWNLFDKTAAQHKSGVVTTDKLVNVARDAGHNISSANVQISSWSAWNGYDRSKKGEVRFEPGSAPKAASKPAAPKKAAVKKSLPKPPAKKKTAPAPAPTVEAPAAPTPTEQVA